ncbi:MAG: radical SAM protein [Candidatus Aegiribacteria sp.]|nr:radical SAM protein [Candidatus Aegiribacteria sp.]MBD3294743.1 radical SAM protein [Candidatus Fermentibacteria bacterium]
MDRILLVFPETRYPSGQPPLGLGMLSAVSRSFGLEVRVFDMSFRKNPFSDLRQELDSYRPDTVGISIMTPQLADACRAAGITREEVPEALLIAGGPHATVLPEDTLERTGADLVYSGEAERAWRKLLGGEDPTNIPGFAYMDDGEIQSVPGLLLTEDLDELPLPDRSVFDMEKYFASWYSMDRVDPGLRGTSVMATRGCPFKCTFCQPTLSEIFGRRTRKRSPESILDELELLIREYRIDAFMFEDSTFIVDAEWVHRICDLMLKRDLGLKWCCNVRADLLKEDLLDHMVQAGLSKINMGVESASQRVLDKIYEKGITVEGVRRALRLARSRGVFVQGYFMLGAPGETREEMMKTVKFAASEPFDDALFDITTPFPHTELWERTKELIRNDYQDFDCFHKSVYELEGFDPSEIERIKKRAFWRFYLHPQRILKTIRTALGPANLRRTLIKARRV